jgi:hypothetical protein
MGFELKSLEPVGESFMPLHLFVFINDLTHVHRSAAGPSLRAQRALGRKL